MAAVRLSKGQVLMYLALADSNRSRAAELAGVSRRTFHRAMRRYRIQAPRPQARLRREDVRLVRALADSGVPATRIARQLGVSDVAVRKVRDYATWVEPL